jgi:hypothetical protein
LVSGKPGILAKVFQGHVFRELSVHDDLPYTVFTLNV